MIVLIRFLKYALLSVLIIHKTYDYFTYQEELKKIEEIKVAEKRASANIKAPAPLPVQPTFDPDWEGITIHKNLTPSLQERDKRKSKKTTETAKRTKNN